MFEKTCFLDPGGCWFRLYDEKGNIIARSRSVMIRTDKGLLCSEKALDAYVFHQGKSLIYPVDQGRMIHPVDGLFEDLFRQYPRTRFFLKPSLCILIPHDLEEKEKDKWLKAGLKAGFRKVTFLRALDLIEEDGALMIHAGHSRVTMAFYQNHEPLFFQSIVFGGRAMDQEIESSLCHRLKGLLYEESSHELKEKVSEALWNQTNENFEVSLLDSRQGLVTKSVSAASVWPVMEGMIMQVVYWVKNTLDNMPAAIKKSIEENGIILSGGMAECYGLAALLKMRLNLDVVIRKKPDQLLYDQR